jgi:hypothetical protein
MTSRIDAHRCTTSRNRMAIVVSGHPFPLNGQSVDHIVNYGMM